MKTHTIDSLEDISAADWNELVEDGNPFLRHEFLIAMERHRCVGERTGWLPRHIVCADDNGVILGVAPLYVKTNSYGEFVFDWSWADAYQRYGLQYYPKLVSAVPFTPATGQRLLLRPGEAGVSAAQAIIHHALETMEKYHCSSLHWLFPTSDNLNELSRHGLMCRVGFQFHWFNPGYRDFQDFLDTLTSKKRKNIKRERRLVESAGFELVTLPGSQATDSQWRNLHDYYTSTFHRLGGVPTLTLDFFQEIAATMGEQILLVFARERGRDVAAAISFRSQNALYGRHWGCLSNHDNLHFEACYYQGIEYCIRHGLKTFEPGAQGEHKISRGFLPTLTCSAHWLAHQGFRRAVADFLDRETAAVQDYARALVERSPYRNRLDDA